MSVQVKTPTKTQFERLELGCGETRDVQGDGVKKWKDDSSLNSKFSQPWNRKRRYSQSYRREENAIPLRRKRIKSAYFDKPLPMKFLNGGSIDDPLNLNGLDSSELGKQLNSVTPQSSPLPTPKRESVKVRIPVNVTDPLNLNESDDSLLKATKKKRHRHTPKDNVCHQKPRMVCDKIVSPVIRHATPKHKKRRRTNSEGKPEPSATTSRSLLTSSSSSNTSPKKFKQPKLPFRGKGNKSMQGEQPKFVYGNYNRYYGYRNPALEKDHRIDCFLREWFEGKHVLDIGCNVGHLTLAVAKEFNPLKMIGIDIDHRLITAARKNIRYHMSSEAPEANKFPISNVFNYGPIEAPPVRQKGKTSFPHNIMFMQGNYVLEHDELLDLQKEEYDVIMALSITKWIHFNWGDDGLKRFFKRIFKQLRPGGMFILEPQPWSSYKKKKKLNDTIFQNFQSIRLRPEQFNDFLLSKEVGFSTCNTVDVPMNKSKGFRRPIVVFKKSETVQNTPLSEHGHITPVRSLELPQVFAEVEGCTNDEPSDVASTSTAAVSSSKHTEIVQDKPTSTGQPVEETTAVKEQEKTEVKTEERSHEKDVLTDSQNTDSVDTIQSTVTEEVKMDTSCEVHSSKEDVVSDGPRTECSHTREPCKEGQIEIDMKSDITRTDRSPEEGEKMKTDLEEPVIQKASAEDSNTDKGVDNDSKMETKVDRTENDHKSAEN